MPRRGRQKIEDDPAVVLAREEKCWEMRCNFATESQIAKELGITQPGVSKMLKRIVKARQHELTHRVIDVQLLQIRQLTAIASEAWEAWQMSKSKRASLQKKTFVDQSTPVPPQPGQKPSKALIRYGGRKFEETVMRTQEEYGQPAYLALCLKALGDIRSITGADAPKVLTVKDARAMLHELTGTPMEDLPEGPEQVDQMPEFTEGRIA